MKIYEDYSRADEWDITSTLELDDDGKFRYDEYWTSYGGSTGGRAQGRWRRSGDTIFFQAEDDDGFTSLRFLPGQERQALEQGDVLNFGNGFTLRLKREPAAAPFPKQQPAVEREEVIPVRNGGVKPLTVFLEPWGISHVVAPGEQVYVVARGPGDAGGELEVTRGEDEVIVYGWSGSRVVVVLEKDYPKPPVAEKTERAVPPAPTVRSEVKAPAASPPPLPPVIKSEVKKIEPISLSPELVARIRQRISELPVEGLQYRLQRLCREFNFLMLHATMIYMWALSTDGFVMCLDHEAFNDKPEPEPNPLTIYAVLVRGARKYPELSELIPPCPEGARQCELCAGEGWTKSPDGAASNLCFRCNGLGWYAPSSTY